MTKKELIAILQKLLQTDTGFGFLHQLKIEDLETLVACVRSRVEAG